MGVPFYWNADYFGACYFRARRSAVATHHQDATDPVMRRGVGSSDPVMYKNAQASDEVMRGPSVSDAVMRRYT